MRVRFGNDALATDCEFRWFVALRLFVLFTRLFGFRSEFWLLSRWLVLFPLNEDCNWLGELWFENDEKPVVGLLLLFFCDLESSSRFEVTVVELLQLFTKLLLLEFEFTLRRPPWLQLLFCTCCVDGCWPIVFSSCCKYHGSSLSSLLFSSSLTDGLTVLLLLSLIKSNSFVLKLFIDS